MSQLVVNALTAKFTDAILQTTSAHGDETVWVKADQLVAIATWLKTDAAMAFDAPVFVTCIDYIDWQPSGVKAADQRPATLPRYEVCYQLRSSTKRHRIRLKVFVDEQSPRCPSLAPLWPAFNWQERETFDMYGIEFVGHPDLRRIYLYDEFVGHPLRKDYPKDKRQPLVRRDDLPVNPTDEREARTLQRNL